MTAAPEKIWMQENKYYGGLSATIQPVNDIVNTEYTRSDIANARIAELESALRLIVNGYGPNHMSKYARDVAASAINGKK